VKKGTHMETKYGREKESMYTQVESEWQCILTRLVEIRLTFAFSTVITVRYRHTPYDTAVAPYSTTLTVIWPFSSNSGPKHFFSFCNHYL